MQCNFNSIYNFDELSSYVRSLKVSNISYSGKRKFYNPKDHIKLSINQIMQKLYDCYNEKYNEDSLLNESDLKNIKEIVNRIRRLNAKSNLKLDNKSLLVKINHFVMRAFGDKIKIKTQRWFFPKYKSVGREEILREIEGHCNRIQESHYLSHSIKTDLNKTVKRALDNAFENYYSQPYADDYKKRQATWKTQGQVIHRYNHGLSHAVRKAFYIPFVVDYFERHSKDHLRTQLQTLFAEQGKAAVIAKLQIVMAFEVAGRNSECGAKDDLNVYLDYLDASKEAFKKYCRDQDLVGDHKLFKDEEELELYGKTITDKHPNRFRSKEEMDVLTAIIDTGHTLDLFRCFWPYQIRESINEINIYTKDKNNRDLWSLAKFCQQAVKITGDRLMTEFEDDSIRDRNLKIKTSDFRAIFYHNFHLRKSKTFIKCSSDANYCWGLLKGVPPPISYSKGETTHTYLEGYKALVEGNLDLKVKIDSSEPIEELRSILSETRGAIRLVNTKNNAFQFEMKMLNDPVFFRPLRKTPPDRDYVLTDRAARKVEHRGYKERVSLMKQEEDKGVSSDHKYPPVHDSQDRGKPKFTEYSKKLSISLLRKDGRVKHFKGQWPKEYYTFSPVGMLYDVDQLNQKNNKFIFDYDTGTSSKFWIGKKAYKEVDKKIGRDKDLTLSDLQQKLDAEVDEGIEPQFLPFAKMQHASNEMLMGLSKRAFKGLFSPIDESEAKLNVFLQAVYLAQDYGKIVPVMIIDGENPPRIYSQEELLDDLRKLSQKKIKSRSYSKLLTCFYTPEELKNGKGTPDNLFKECIQSFDLSVLPVKSVEL